MAEHMFDADRGQLAPNTTAAIVDAVFEELAERDYRGPSMDRIAARAGVGKAALYRRWRSKQAMLVDVVARVGTGTVLPPDDGLALDGRLERFGVDARTDRRFSRRARGSRGER